VLNNFVIEAGRTIAEDTDEPVTIGDAKAWLKVDLTDDDALITDLINTARTQVEEYTGTAVVACEVVAVIDNSAGDLELPYGPVSEITEVLNENGDEITDYTTTGSAFLKLKDPKLNYLKLTYKAGFTQIPPAIIIGLKQQLTWVYENRGDDAKMGQLSPMAMQTLKPMRRIW